MRYRRLGEAGVRVSEVSLGSWLTYGGSVADDQAYACIRAALDLGVNLFDTANAYRRGAAERLVGAALADVPRDEYVLATKVFFPMGDGPNARGLSRKHLFEQCHASLRRLGTDYLDLYQCHRPDPETPLQETLRALDDLVGQGKVLYVGVSEWSSEQLEEARHLQAALGLHPIVSNQPQYSLLARSIEEDVLPAGRRLGIGQLIWSPLAQGVLSGKYIPGAPPPPDSRGAHPEDSAFMRSFLREETLHAVGRLRPIAAELGLSLPQLAIAWTLRDPGVSSAIIGASRAEQVREDVAASGVTLPSEALERIDAALAPVPVAGAATY